MKSISRLLSLALPLAFQAFAAGVAPTAVAQSLYTLKGTPLTITLAAFDPEGDPLTFNIVAKPANGALSAVSGNTVVYTPNAGFSGLDTFTFQANDGATDSAAEKVNVIAQTGTVIRVGSTRQYKTVQDGINAAPSYSVVELDPETYVGPAAVASISGKPGLTIRGVGGRPVLDAQLTAKSRKAILVASSAYLTIENLELKNAYIVQADGGNAAGIRMEGGDLTVRGCYIHDNQNGLLGSDNAAWNLLVENTELDHNQDLVRPSQGGHAGLTHNIYVGFIHTFTLRNSYSHGVQYGHLVKTKAQRNLILYNRITDNVDGQNSDSVDIPYGGTSFLIGNLFYQCNEATLGEADPELNGSRNMVRFGEESGSPRANWGVTLYLVNNTFVSATSAPKPATWIWVRSWGYAVLTNNIFMGNGVFTIPTGHDTRTTNLVTMDAQLANPAAFDDHLTSSSAAINAGTDLGSLNPVAEYSHPVSASPRVGDGAVDIGAYEYQPCAANLTNRFTVTHDPYYYDSATQRFVQPMALTLTNYGIGGAVQGPFSFVLDNLSANAKLFNFPQSTTCAAAAGSPYVNVPGPATLVRGGSILFTLEFENPSKGAITYYPRVLAGPGQR